MVRTSFATLTVTALLVTSTAPGAPPAAGSDGTPAEATFDVRSERVLQAGQRMHVQADGIREHTLTALGSDGERIVEQTALAIGFTAEAEIAAVGADGAPTEIRYHVAQCDAVSDGRSLTIVPAGATLVARRSGTTTTFTVDGDPLDALRREALALVVALPTGAATDDASARRIVGEAWSVDGPAAARRMAQHLDRPEHLVNHAADRDGAPSASDAVTATSSLLDVRDHHGRACLVVRTSLEGGGLSVPAPAGVTLPAGATVDASSFTAVHQQVLPIDPALPALADTASVESVTMLTVPEAGAPVTMRRSERRFARVETLPVETSALTAAGDRPDPAGE